MATLNNCNFVCFASAAEIYTSSLITILHFSNIISFLHIISKGFLKSAISHIRFCLRNLKKFWKNMDQITKIWIGPLPKDSPYVKPFRFYYVQNDKEKNWDLMKVHDSVAIIIFNKSKQKLIFVKQFRPAVFHGIVTTDGGDISDVDLKKYPPSLGVTTELCAGIVDKEMSWQEIAREEILEECGYDVPVERVEEVMTYRSGVGSQGSKQKMYYCEVTDADKCSSGGGVDDELIDVIEYSIEEARKMVQQGSDNNSPPSCLLGVMWFLMNKAPKE